MNDRCPQCNSIHFYTKRNVSVQWDSSKIGFGEKRTPAEPVADNHSDMLVECLDCHFSCLLKEFPEVKASLEKQKMAEEQEREIAYTRSKIKVLYESGKKKEAEQFYLQKHKFTESTPNIDEVYRQISKSKNQSLIFIVILSILVFTALIWLLFPYFWFVVIAIALVSLIFTLKSLIRHYF